MFCGYLTWLRWPLAIKLTVVPCLNHSTICRCWTMVRLPSYDHGSFRNVHIHCQKCRQLYQGTTIVKFYCLTAASLWLFDCMLCCGAAVNAVMTSSLSSSSRAPGLTHRSHDINGTATVWHGHTPAPAYHLTSQQQQSAGTQVNTCPVPPSSPRYRQALFSRLTARLTDKVYQCLCSSS